MVRTGPCAVRAVVGGDIKCHCELGTAKRFFEGTKPPYVGLDVCDAYRCKKDGGVKVEKTGLHKRADKRPRTEGGGSGSGGGGCSGRGGDGITADFLVQLVRPDQIIGHRLHDVEPLHHLDARRGEKLLCSNYLVEFYVRGIFARSDTDPGLCDTFWRPQHELAEYAKQDAEAYGRVLLIVNAYRDEITMAFNRALGVPDGGCERSPQYSPLDTYEAAEEAAAAETEAVEAAAETEAAEADGGPGFNGAAAAAAAATTTAAHHDELVTAMNAHIEAKQSTLCSIYTSFVGDQRVSPSEFSIWLRRTTVTPRSISARKAAQIDAAVAAFLQQAAAAAPAPAAAPAQLAAAAGTPAVLTRT
jgi:hypothetical protein